MLPRERGRQRLREKARSRLRGIWLARINRTDPTTCTRVRGHWAYMVHRLGSRRLLPGRVERRQIVGLDTSSLSRSQDYHAPTAHVEDDMRGRGDLMNRPGRAGSSLRWWRGTGNATARATTTDSRSTGVPLLTRNDVIVICARRILPVCSNWKIAFLHQTRSTRVQRVLWRIPNQTARKTQW